LNVSEEGAKIVLSWETEDLRDVQKAKDIFMKLTRQGWLAARRNDGLRRTLEFNPEDGELYFIPLAEGG